MWFAAQPLSFVALGSSAQPVAFEYIGLVDIAQVVAAADLVEGLANKRREVLTETYTAEVDCARALVAEARSDKERARRNACVKKSIALPPSDTPVREIMGMVCIWLTKTWKTSNSFQWRIANTR